MCHFCLFRKAKVAEVSELFVAKLADRYLFLCGIVTFKNLNGSRTSKVFERRIAKPVEPN